MIKNVLGALVAGLGAWLLYQIVLAPPAAAQPVTSFTSSQQCQECHAQVFEEWQGSQHAFSYRNPRVRELSNEFSNKDCIDCHAPQPVFVTGMGERVLPRSARMAEGVDCIACHALPPEPDGSPGGMAGTVSSDRAACRPVQRRELQRPQFCAGCHDQHKTVRQWAASSWADRKDCLDCHMPYRDGNIENGRDHRCLGGNDLGLLRSAVELRATRDGAGVAVELENVGAGHAFPTDERSRAADLFWRPLADAETPNSWRHLYRFRSPYRDEVDVPDTLLAADATWSGRIDDPDAAAGIEVVLYYKRSPWYTDRTDPAGDDDAVLVHRVEVAP